MSFISVPETSMGHIFTGHIVPRTPLSDPEANGAADSPPPQTGLCYTCLCWMYRCIPVLVIFLIINCIRAVFFDQRAAFTIINITLGLILFAVVTVSVYTFISLQFHRLQQSRPSYFHPPSSAVSTISRSSRATRDSAPNGNDVSGFMDDLGLDGFRCTRCSTLAANDSSSDNTSTAAGSSTEQAHSRQCPHRRNRQRKSRPIVDPLDCVPPYENPPKYEELCAVALAQNIEPPPPNAQIQPNSPV